MTVIEDVKMKDYTYIIKNVLMKIPLIIWVNLVGDFVSIITIFI